MRVPPPSSPPLLVPSADALRALGASLGQVLQAGDTVGLVGPLGAGKTTFAQGVALGLGVPPERHVASPTFALVNEHPGRVPLVHADLYRLEDEAELAELGLDERADEVVRLVEWVDRFPSRIGPALIVSLAFCAEGRSVAFTGPALAEARLRRWLDARLAAPALIP